MPPITFRATRDLLHPRVRAWGYVVWYPETGQVHVVYPAAPLVTPELSSLLTAGALVPESARDNDNWRARRHGGEYEAAEASPASTGLGRTRRGKQRLSVIGPSGRGPRARA